MATVAPRIKSVEIGPYPKAISDPLPKVTATMDDGQVVELFTFYPDEISVGPLDFIGCTVDDARRLKFVKDRRFLRDQ